MAIVCSSADIRYGDVDCGLQAAGCGLWAGTVSSWLALHIPSHSSAFTCRYMMGISDSDVEALEARDKHGLSPILGIGLHEVAWAKSRVATGSPRGVM